MAEFKVVISDPKSGKSVQKDVKEDQAKNLIGLKIGDVFKGEMLDLTGYEFQITGGSDYCGFPMRKDVAGTIRKRILAVKGVGVSNKKKARGKDMKYMRTMKGMRQRISVAGNTIFEKTAQVNLRITKQGKADIFPKKEEAAKPAETKVEAQKAEAKPEAPKHEAKPEKPAEKKAEEKKEAHKEKPKKEEKPAEKK